MFTLEERALQIGWCENSDQTQTQQQPGTDVINYDLTEPS
jgi:hypothetical protein